MVRRPRPMTMTMNARDLVNFARMASTSFWAAEAFQDLSPVNAVESNDDEALGWGTIKRNDLFGARDEFSASR